MNKDEIKQMVKLSILQPTENFASSLTELLWLKSQNKYDLDKHVKLIEE